MNSYRELRPANAQVNNGRTPVAVMDKVIYFGLPSDHMAVRCIAQLHFRYKAMEAELNASKENYQTQEAALNDAKKNSQKLEETITSLTEKNKAQEVVIAELMAKCKNLEDNLGQSNAQNSQLLDVANKHRESIETCQRECRDLRAHWPGVQQNVASPQQDLAFQQLAPQQQAGQQQQSQQQQSQQYQHQQDQQQQQQQPNQQQQVQQYQNQQQPDFQPLSQQEQDLLMEMLSMPQFGGQQGEMQGGMQGLPDIDFGNWQDQPGSFAQPPEPFTNGGGANQTLSQEVPLLFQPFNPNLNATADQNQNQNQNNDDFNLDDWLNQDYGLEPDFSQFQPDMMDFGNNTQ